MLLIEDVITADGAVLKAAQALRAGGATVTMVVCAIDRSAPGKNELVAEGMADTRRSNPAVISTYSHVDAWTSSRSRRSAPRAPQHPTRGTPAVICNFVFVTYDFRVRAALGTTVKIESPETKLEILDSDPVKVVIRSLNADQPLTDSREIVIHGTGYPTEEEAASEGSRWRGHIMVGFARVSIGADFGDRAPMGGMSDWFLQQKRAANPDTQLFNDAPGVLVFPTDPPATFGRLQAAGVVGKMGPEVVLAVRKARERDAGLPDRLRLAYDLYSASFFQPAADARFLMLAMALETIIQQRGKPEDVRELVDALIGTVRDAGLEQGAVDSLVGALRGLKQESVGQAGRRLGDTLGNRTYMDMAAVKFFSHCYALRSQLVHGSFPRPTREQVDLAAAHLEKFVGDLLAIDLLDEFPH